MKYVKLFTVMALISAFTTASFAGSCCSKKKKKDADKPKVEQQDKK